MRRSKKRNLLVLISDPFKGLYRDRWKGDVLHYTGMGLRGDQSLDHAQNRTLADAPKTEITLHLFEALSPLKYTYVGEVALIDKPYQENQMDEEENTRKVWMFPVKIKEGGLRPEPSDAQAREIEESQARNARRLTTRQLKDRAKRAKKKPVARTAEGTIYVRDAAVAEYTKRLANGTCDLCEGAAPFKNKRNEPYLECHHIVWLAQGGDDTIENTVALCPNCHRKMHALNRTEDKSALRTKANHRAAL